MVVGSRSERVLCTQCEAVDPVAMALEHADKLAIRVVPGTYADQEKREIRSKGTLRIKLMNEEI